MNKYEVIHSSLIRSTSKLLVPKKSQFRLLDDLDSDNWNDYEMNWEKVKLYDDKLFLRDSGVVLTFKGDILWMITDYDSNKTHSPDAKQVIKFLVEMHFDVYTKAKSCRDKNVKETFKIKKLYKHQVFKKYCSFRKSKRIMW